ncbi:hypothetical protein PCE1_003038 [Barthelona sp. PCE]
MGIKGLLPLLQEATRKVTLSAFRGKTAAMDGHAFLHRSFFSCAEDLAKGNFTMKYVYFFEKIVKKCRDAGVEPYFVFDGGANPLKADEAVSRREKRVKNLEKAESLPKSHASRQSLFAASISVNFEHIRNVMNHLNSLDVRCMIAPYEADPQLAYMVKTGICDFVICEDSDLLVYQTHEVFLKGTWSSSVVHGDAIKFEEIFTLKKFRFWKEHTFVFFCLLLGSDYTSNPHRVGPKRLFKIFSGVKTFDIHSILQKIYSIDPNFRQQENMLIQAFSQFIFGLVYCPNQQRLVRLSMPDSQLEGKLQHLGNMFDDDVAREVAIGLRDPFTHERQSMAVVEKIDTRHTTVAVVTPKKKPRSSNRISLGMSIAPKAEEEEEEKIPRFIPNHAASSDSNSRIPRFIPQIRPRKHVIIDTERKAATPVQRKECNLYDNLLATLASGDGEGAFNVVEQRSQSVPVMEPMVDETKFSPLRDILSPQFDKGRRSAESAGFVFVKDSANPFSAVEPEVVEKNDLLSFVTEQSQYSQKNSQETINESQNKIINSKKPQFGLGSSSNMKNFRFLKQQNESEDEEMIPKKAQRVEMKHSNAQITPPNFKRNTPFDISAYMFPK